MQIGPYEVLLELGRGGMGTVYLARLLGAGGFERLVAIKRAHSGSADQGRTAARFLREARLAASVHHANVVAIHQVGEDEDGQYLACEYVEGEALAGLIDQGSSSEPIPVPIALRIVLDALAGLHAAHETVDNSGAPLGILHRDVSIENLLVGRDGVTRLTDFGIAKSAAHPGLTDAGTIHGKILYMTPEYLQGDEGERSDDTYAMGVTLWIALTGALPYRVRDNAAMVQEVLANPIPSLDQVGARVGPELAHCVARAVSRDRSQRFETALAMLHALEAVSARETPAARHLDVAAFVERVAGARLAARRARIQQRRAAPESPTSAAKDAVIFATEAAPVTSPKPLSRALPPALALAAGIGFLAWFALSGDKPSTARSIRARQDAHAATPAPESFPKASPVVDPEPALPHAAVQVEQLAHDAGPADAAAPAYIAPRRAPKLRRPAGVQAEPARQVSPEAPEKAPEIDISTTNPYR